MERMRKAVDLAKSVAVGGFAAVMDESHPVSKLGERIQDSRRVSRHPGGQQVGRGLEVVCPRPHAPISRITYQAHWVTVCTSHM